jgi:hypothetical protein
VVLAVAEVCTLLPVVRVFRDKEKTVALVPQPTTFRLVVAVVVLVFKDQLLDQLLAVVWAVMV